MFFTIKVIININILVVCYRHSFPDFRKFTIFFCICNHVLYTTLSHLPCTEVSLALCTRIRDRVAAWVNALQLNSYTHKGQLLYSDPLSRIPTARSSWRPAPSTPTQPPLIPFILSSNPCIVSHLDRSHCLFLATHRWLRDCANRCIVGNHFDQARGHSQGQYISSSACIRSYQGRTQELTPKE